MIRRTFYKVGNGLFCYEQAGEMINVYDCGGQNKSVIDIAISCFKNSTPKPTHIHNLFISHYDRDHVNGLTSLLENISCDRVFLPMIHPLVRVVDYAQRRNDSDYTDFIFNPEEYIMRFQKKVEIITVRGDESEMESGNVSKVESGDVSQEKPSNNFNTLDNGVVRINLPYIQYEGPNKWRTYEIRNGTDYVVNNWLFRVFNKRVMNQNELSQFMSRLNLSVHASFHDVLNALAAKNTNLKKALSAVFSQEDLKLINDYSMVVWSGPNNLADRNGCLFTGDYNAKKNIQELMAEFKYLKHRTKIVQIPHHGSSYNFNIMLCDASFRHVISSSNGSYKCRRLVNPTATISSLNRNSLSYDTTFNGDVVI
ncbi:MAG: hypothetical protein K2M12_03185 [Muribaculaceae bacterium]|nr:hypothetical protein [Muribaculaceae bacterium]